MGLPCRARECFTNEDQRGLSASLVLLLLTLADVLGFVGCGDFTDDKSSAPFIRSRQEGHIVEIRLNCRCNINHIRGSGMLPRYRASRFDMGCKVDL